jgi:ComF family protein
MATEAGGGMALARLRPAILGALRVIYPPQCLTCEAQVGEEGTLCPACWPEVPFIHGLACDACGIPLAGESATPVRCDDCLAVARPWGRGRAVLLYAGGARRLVLGLKYGDRHDVAAPAGRWLARAARPLLRADSVIVPVPLHWWRLFRRRYNQAALLSAALARETGAEHLPDLLVRRRPTGNQDGRSRADRFANLRDAIVARRARAPRVEGRHVLLVDDVMTSGATLAASAEACFAAGADAVDVIALARVGRAETP